MRKRKALGKAIKAIREARAIGDSRFRVSRFATTVQMSAGHLCNIESGSRSATPEALERIAVALDVPLDAISIELPVAPLVAA